MEKSQARVKYVVLIVRAEATDGWLFLQDKRSGLWSLPMSKLMWRQKPFLVASHRLVHLYPDGYNLSTFCELSIGDHLVSTFMSDIEFEKSLELPRGVSGQLWATPTDFLTIDAEKVSEFTRMTIELIVETAQKMYQE